MAYKNKEDQKAYARNWYLKNKQLTLDRSRGSNARGRERNLKYIRDIKNNSLCVDCGKSYHFSAMDFDHVDDNKEHSVSKLANMRVSIKRLQQEIDKCETVCSNCHRVRTYSRRCGETVNTVASKATARVV